jgi:hypothetical protein
MPQGKPSGPRRELPPMINIDAEEGPAMARLPSDRHRAFVRALYQVPAGIGYGSTAARMSGWGCEDSSPSSMSTIASRLMHDERVLAAVHEEDRKRIRASAPRAIRALSQLIEDPDSRNHVRAVQMIMDRTHPVETSHTVTVEHRASSSMQATAEVFERIMQLAERAKVAPMIDVTPGKS